MRNDLYARKKRIEFDKIKKCISRKLIGRHKIEVINICQCCEQRFKKVDRHHPDYDRPLFVIPLCRGCHVSLHVSIKSCLVYSDKNPSYQEIDTYLEYGINEILRRLRIEDDKTRNKLITKGTI